MPDPSRDRDAGPRIRTRRSVLAVGLALGATGCTLSDPAVRPAGGAPPSASRRPTPTPTPFAPGLERDQAAEAALAASALVLLEVTGVGQKRRRDLLTLVARCHRERAVALAAPDPTSRPTAGTSTSTQTGSTPSASSPSAPRPSRLVADERALERRYRSRALASSGPAALLWGSMAVASSSFAAALAVDDPPPSADVAAHRPLRLVSDTEAVSALVAALHAVVWGYQLATGRLPAGASRDRALAGLQNHRALQDRLVGQLLQAGVEVPPAAPAYDPDPEVRDAADARLLIRRMEGRLLPFCGLWLAAAGRTAERRLALDTLGSTLNTATSWGAPLLAWPGWAD